MSTQNPLVSDVSRSKVPIVGVILLLIVGVIVAAVVGAVVAASSVYVIYAIVVFPALMGVIAGGAISRAAKSGKVRSLGVITLFAILTGLLMYGVYRYGEYYLTRMQVSNDLVAKYGSKLTPDQIQQGIDTLFVQEGGAPGFVGFVNFSAKQGVGLKFGSSYSSVSDKSPATITLTGPMAWVYWGAELLLILGLAAYQARKGINVPFCEKDNKYFVNINQGRVARESADQFLAQAKAGNWSAAAAMISPARGKVVYPHLAVIAQKCPDCNTNNVPVKVVRKISSRSNSDRIIFKAMLTPAQYTDLSGASQAASLGSPQAVAQVAQ